MHRMTKLLSHKAQTLSEGERRFVEHFVNTGDQNIALRESGLPSNTGHTVRRLRTDPRIIAAIQMEVATKIRTEGASVAIDTLLEIARDKSAPKGARVDSAKTLLDRAGHIAPRAETSRDDASRQLAEYSIEELRALVSNLEKTRGDQARDVTGATLSTPLDAQLIDMMG
jgi:hypothetical protein